LERRNLWRGNVPSHDQKQDGGEQEQLAGLGQFFRGKEKVMRATELCLRQIGSHRGILLPDEKGNKNLKSQGPMEGANRFMEGRTELAATIF